MMVEAAVMLDADENPTENPEEAVIVRYFSMDDDGNSETYDVYLSDETDHDDPILEDNSAVEKGILGTIGNFAGRAVQYFKGTAGYWVTREGRRVFVDSAKGEEALVAGALKVTTSLEKFKDSIPLVEKLLNEHSVGSLRHIKGVILTDIGDDALGSFNVRTKILKIDPAANQWVATWKYLNSKGITPDKKYFYEKLMRETVSHEIAHSFFTTSESVGGVKSLYRFVRGKAIRTDITPAKRSFVEASLRERGVSPYARSVLKKANKGIYSILGVERDSKTIYGRTINRVNAHAKEAVVRFSHDEWYAGENFAEMYSFFRQRHNYPKQWEEISKRHPRTTKAFLALIEELDA